VTPAISNALDKLEQAAAQSFSEQGNTKCYEARQLVNRLIGELISEYEDRVAAGYLWSMRNS
jgi:hypothetical protein